MAFDLQIAKIILGKDFQRIDAVIFRAFSYLYSQLGICPMGSSQGELVNMNYIWFCRGFWLRSQKCPFHSVVWMCITGHMVHERVVLQLVHLVGSQKQHLKAVPLQNLPDLEGSSRVNDFVSAIGVKDFGLSLGLRPCCLPFFGWGSKSSPDHHQTLEESSSPCSFHEDK